jgi:hypothetical protein
MPNALNDGRSVRPKGQKGQQASEIVQQWLDKAKYHANSRAFGPLRRLCFSLSFLIMMVIGIALVLQKLELPEEKKRIAAAKAEYDKVRRHLAVGVFSFVATRDESPLCPSYRKWAGENAAEYGGPYVKNITRHRETWDSLANTQRTSTCAKCFPDADSESAAAFNPDIPQSDPGGKQYWWNFNHTDVTEDCIRNPGAVHAFPTYSLTFPTAGAFPTVSTLLLFMRL